MHPTIWRPRGRLSIIENELNDLFRTSAWFRPTATWNPAIDVSENDKEITVRAELPGMNSEDVELTIEDHHMTLKGEKKSEKKNGGENDHWRECFYGSFSRTFRLPDNIETKKIKATLKDGVLEVTLPKQAEAKPKRISVEMN